MEKPKTIVIENKVYQVAACENPDPANVPIEVFFGEGLSIQMFATRAEADRLTTYLENREQKNKNVNG